tara:strand:+ start:1644 stop:2258 length:615 start_codon:yes stop_codon:yes gene_type:complete
MIETKPKKCKGIGKAKGFKSCGKETLYRKFGLCDSCRCDWLINDERGRIELQKATLQATKPRKEFQQYKKERKDRNSLTTLLESVKNVCHKYIRLRDKNKPCISCKAPYHSEHQAGHLYKAELFATIKFHEFNINGQCIKCNIRREGNEGEYRVNLPKIIGKENFEEINRLAELDHRINHKWDRQELIEIRKYYQNKIKNNLRQ